MINEKITVETIVNAPLEKVWDAWTNPSHITGWNFASDDWRCPEAQNDLRKGGKFKIRMEAKNGGEGFDFEGVYDEVVPGKRIAYTVGDGRKVEVDFAEADGKTRVAETFDAEHENPIEMQRGGWQSILENFRKYVEALS